MLFSCKLFLFDLIELENSPDLFFILSIYLALFVREKEAILGACFLGMMKDLSSCELCGLFTFFFLLTTIMVVKIRKEIILNELIQIIIVFFFALQNNILHSSFVYFRYGVDIFEQSFICSLYTACTSPFLIFFFNKTSLVVKCKKL